jgi:hypothetical protein
VPRILNKQPKRFAVEFWQTSDPDADPDDPDANLEFMSIVADEREFDTLEEAIAAGTAAAPDYPDHIQISEYGNIELVELEPGYLKWDRGDATNHHDL